MTSWETKSESLKSVGSSSSTLSRGRLAVLEMIPRRIPLLRSAVRVAFAPGTHPDDGVISVSPRSKKIVPIKAVVMGDLLKHFGQAN